MTIKQCLDTVDGLKPNQYSVPDKVKWLSYLDGTIKKDILDTHELSEGEIRREFRPYSPDELEAELLVEFPYDELYIAFLKMKIDEENGETARYNNSAEMFNSYMSDFAKNYNRTHMPVQKTGLKIF